MRGYLVDVGGMPGLAFVMGSDCCDDEEFDEDEFDDDESDEVCYDDEEEDE